MEPHQDITRWRDDAHQKLSEAQQVCNIANEYIMLTRNKLTLREDRLPKLIFYLDAMKQQLRLLGIIKDSLSLNIHRVLEKKTSLKNKINRELAKLNTIITSLKSIKVDPSLNEHGAVLFDFISEDDLNGLYHDIVENLKQLDELLKNNRTDALIIRMASDLESLQNEFNSLHSQFNDFKLNKINDSKDPVTQLIGINNELEMDMVSILESFNNHYDQCVKGATILNDNSIPKPDKLDLLNVLKNDVLELPQAMGYLENDREIIIKNCKEIIKITGIFDTFYERVNTYFKSLKEYGEEKLVKQLEEFNEINVKLKDLS
ncbi:unnamed protein product [Ambrosiozyma monospora]|uniref:Unnamed protein product n=1 Tax=Ambrosiozyma monospora TaxID=43982 RepID=A0ACB5T319_AMBMO|nr:unnamed protein product [Ambrosiozyma monospora]